MGGPASGNLTISFKVTAKDSVLTEAGVLCMPV